MKVFSLSLNKNLALTIEPKNESQLRQLAYAEKLDKFTIVCKTPGSPNYQQQKLSEKLTVLPSISRTRWSFLGDAWRLGCKILASEDYDLITCQDAYYCGLIGYFLARRFNLPLNIQLHSDFDSRYWLKENPVNYWFHWLGSKLLKRADSVRVVSQAAKASLIKKGLDRERVFVCPIGIDRKIFTACNAQGKRTALLAESEKYLVLSVGRLVAAKDYPTLIKVSQIVTRRLPEVKFVIIGKGRDRQNLEKLIIKNKLLEKVVFLGAVDYKDLASYYAACDVFLLTSVYEGFGRVLVEAGAASKPVVSTKTAGGQEIVVDRETGLLAEVGDCQEIANQLIYLLTKPELRKKMGEAGRKRSEKYRFNKTVKELIEGWRRTIKY